MLLLPCYYLLPGTVRIPALDWLGVEVDSLHLLRGSDAAARSLLLVDQHEVDLALAVGQVRRRVHGAHQVQVHAGLVGAMQQLQ